LANKASTQARERSWPVPAGLYERARERLLANEPLRAESRPGASVTEGELAALHRVGLNTHECRDGEADPLLESIADYMGLLETSYTTTEAAEQLEVDISRIRQRLRERSLYGVEYDGEKRLPRFQFERQCVLPGLREVLQALPEDLNPLDVAEWFLSPNPDLEMRQRVLSPRQWLLSGGAVERAVILARDFVTAA
jgi:hypothetical protein